MKSLLLAVAATVTLSSFAYADPVGDANSAEDALGKGNYQEAIRLFTEALDSGGLSAADQESAYVERAKAYLGENKRAAALSDAQKALSLNPKDSDAIAMRDKVQVPAPASEGPVEAETKSTFAPACKAPLPPIAPDGASSTYEQMAAAAGGARNFMALSDVYQTCLVDYVNAGKDLAIKNQTSFDVAIETIAMNKIRENQTEKEIVGNEINAALAVFKASH